MHFDDQPIERNVTEARVERLSCKSCMTNEISAVFIDCGHYVACIVCAVRMIRSPICGDIVKRAMHTFF